MLKPLNFLFLIGCVLSSCIKSENCDLVIHNAHIYSMNSANDIFDAMAIKDGKIVELGHERQILNKYTYKASYDAKLMTILPGFIDAHCHFTGYGLSLQQADLTSCRSFKEVIEVLAEYKVHHTDRWLQARGWDHTKWSGSDYPDKSALDSLFPDIPVVIRRVDGHAALANRVALDLAGISKETQVPGGHIEVLNDELTGILVDNAVDSILKLIPNPTKDQLIKALIDAQENCFKVGLTTVDDAGLTKREVDIIEALHDQGILKIRVYAMLTDNQENFDHYLKAGPHKTDLLNVRSFKFYGDGALGSGGACLLNPYLDSPSSYGMLLNSEDYFRTWAKRIYNSGFQMNTHCIGDSATRLILNIYGELLKHSNDKRWRIEHAQLVHKSDIHLFGKYSIIPSVQPTHATSDMRWAALRVGAQRLKYGYAYNDLRKQNGMVALGTDFPVENISPIETFYAAVTRKSRNGNQQNRFQPENALTRLNALKGMTIWAATSNFEDTEKGSLEKGKFADFIVLNRNLLSCLEEEILRTKIIRTYINGVCVYDN